MRPYVNEVEFTIQGGGKYALGPKTLIVGPNAIGKSSITRAIELAGSGSASDIAGRAEVSLDADLAALGGSGSVASATATLSTDLTSEWALAKGKKAKRSGPEILFPVRELRNAIVGKSVANVRKFFLSNVVTIGWDDVLHEIPTQFHEKLTPYKLKTGADSLIAAAEGMRRRVLDLNREAKTLRENAKLQATGLAPEASADEIRKARAASGMKNAGKLVAGLYADLAYARGRANDMRKNLDTALANLEALPAVTPLPEVVEQAMRVGEWIVANKREVCPICNGDTALVADRVTAARAKVQATLDAMNERAAREEALAIARRDDGEAQQVLASVVRRLEENGLDVNGSAPSGEAPASDLEGIVRVSERWAAIRQAEGRALDLEADAANVAKIGEACSTALERLLTRSIGAFEQRVQRYLPKSMTFGIELRDGDREVCRVGLRGSSGLRMALCGAEWATMTAALAAALVEGASADVPVVINVEDRDFDPKTLGEVMAAFSKIDAQVIITGTKLPLNEVDGWTVIYLSPNADPIIAEKKLRPVNSAANYCDDCDMLIIGEQPCPHGVKPLPRVAPVEGDIFS